MNSNANPIDTVENAMEPVRDSVQTAARAGSQEVRNLFADVEDLIKRVAHLDDADLARARAKLQNTLEVAKTAVHDGTERVKTTAKQAADTTDQYVHSNPWSAVGIAAAAGAAIAVLLSARMHQR
jgi:ElaB/YqjD/DUF883 family membrane-anchored ribosome-binding protein